jgi:hypothetical protein
MQPNAIDLFSIDDLMMGKEMRDSANELTQHLPVPLPLEDQPTRRLIGGFWTKEGKKWADWLTIPRGWRLYVILYHESFNHELTLTKDIFLVFEFSYSR